MWNLWQVFQTRPNAQSSSSKSLAIQKIQMCILQQGIQWFVRFEETRSNSHWFVVKKNHQKIIKIHQNIFHFQLFLFKNDHFHDANSHFWKKRCTIGILPAQSWWHLMSHYQFLILFLGVKPYKCQYCEKSFTQRCSLESHQDKIHGIKCQMPYKKRRDKIYVCEECGFSTGDVRLVLNPTQIDFHNPTTTFHQTQPKTKFLFENIFNLETRL